MTLETINNNTGYKVFVVEDSDAYRTLLVEFISRMKPNKIDYDIYSFSSGEECLASIHMKPDVIILDYMLDSGGYVQNMNGLSFLKELQTLSPATEVVALSCQQSVEVVKEMLNAGASYYIKKDNFSQIKVPQLIEKILQRKEKSKHNSILKVFSGSIVFFAILLIAFLLFYFSKK